MTDSRFIGAEEFVKSTDLSCVRADNTLEDVALMASMAVERGFLCVFALPAHIPRLAALVSGNGNVQLGGVAGFPDGGATTRIKTEAAIELMQMGVDEVDLVVNIAWLKAGLRRAVGRDIESVVNSLHGIPVKVILECSLLTDQEIFDGSRIAADHGATFVKTGTGWAGDTTENHVQTIATAVQDRCKIKAAGGIRTLESWKRFRDLGVARFGLGLSSARAILDEFELST